MRVSIIKKRIIVWISICWRGNKSRMFCAQAPASYYVLEKSRAFTGIQGRLLSMLVVAKAERGIKAKSYWKSLKQPPPPVSLGEGIRGLDADPQHKQDLFSKWICGWVGNNSAQKILKEDIIQTRQSALGTSKPIMNQLTRVHVHQVQGNGVYVHYDHEWDRCLFVCLFVQSGLVLVVLFDSN